MRGQARAATAATLAAWLIAGCVGAPREELPGAGGVEAFADQAQPVLAERCANPSCHGNPSRPLSLYAPRRHRADPGDVYLDTPLTAEELEHDFRQAAVFVAEARRPDESLLLVKPRSPEHGDGLVFLDPVEYDLRRLRAWVRAAHAAGVTP
ncbi:MAG: hypothetical protein IT376_00560 [Polyangiaceae bacterium]|nr:hypothetical protein [Polyangiaceae bacterium]